MLSGLKGAEELLGYLGTAVELLMHLYMWSVLSDHTRAAPFYIVLSLEELSKHLSVDVSLGKTVNYLDTLRMPFCS